MATDKFEEDRHKVSIGYTVLAVVALLVILCPVACRIKGLYLRNPEAFFRLGYAGFFGLLGLTARSWSFKKQGESPFPPYILTYPCIAFGACGAIAALPLEGYRFFFSAPVLAFIIGYLPMEAVDSIRKKFGGG